MNSPHSLREVFVCLDAPTNRPPLQAFACSPLGRSDRPSFARATSAPTLRTTAFAGVRSPLFPSPPDRLCRRSTSDGVGFGANDRPSASRLWRGVSVGFAIADFARYDFASVAASVLRGFLCLRYRSDNNKYSVLRTP